MNLGDLFFEVYVKGLSAFQSAMSVIDVGLQKIGQHAAFAGRQMGLWGGVLGGIGQMAAGVVQIGTAFGILAVGVGKLGGLLARTLSPAVRLIGKVLQPLVPVVKAVGQAFSSVFGPVISLIGGRLASAFQKLGGLATQALTKLNQALQAFKQVAVSVGSAVKNAFVSQIGPIIQALAAKLAPIAAAIKARLGTAFTYVATKAQQMWVQVGPIIAQMSPAFAQAAAGVVNFATGMATTVIGILTQIANAAKGTFNIIAGSAKVAGAAISAIWGNLVPFVGGVFSLLRSVVSGFVGFVRSAFSTMYSIISYPFRKLYDFIFSLKGAIAALGVSMSVYGIGKFLFETTSMMEHAQVSFTAMLGSAKKATQMITDIKKLTDVTPLELPETLKGAESLMAFGFAAREVVDRLTMLGDISQGVGIDLQQLTYIYGKVYEAGRMSGDEFRLAIRDRIPVVSEMAKMLGTTTNEVRKMGSEGLITFGMLDAAFRKLTGEGGRFHNMLTLMGNTLRGRFATLKDSARNVAWELGMALEPAALKALNVLIDLTNKAKDVFAIYRERIKAAADEWGTKFENFGTKLVSMFQSALPYVSEFVKMTFAIKTAFAEIIEEVVTMIATWIGGNGAIGAGVMKIMQSVRFMATEWRLVGNLALAYIHNWHTDGMAFAKEFGKQLLDNLKLVFESGVYIFETLAMAFGEALKGAFKDAVKEIASSFPQMFPGLRKISGEENWKEMRRLFELTGRELAALPGEMGFNADKLFGGAKSKEVIDALDAIKKAYDEFSKSAQNEDAINEFFKKQRAAEAAMRVDLGGQLNPDQTPHLKEHSKTTVTAIRDLWRKLQEGTTPRERQRDDREKKALEFAKKTAENTKKIADRPPGAAAVFAP